MKPSPLIRLRRLRWWFLAPKDAAALLDALRRSTELLDGLTTTGTNSPYYFEEVDHIQAVNRRLIRHYDPAAQTDRKVA